MASSIVLKVANTTATINFTASDAMVAAALTRYATSLGIPTTGTAQENLTAVLLHIVDEVKRRSKAQQIAALEAAQDAANQAAAEGDNAL